jgi:hypothetical protein
LFEFIATPDKFFPALLAEPVRVPQNSGKTMNPLL